MRRGLSCAVGWLGGRATCGTVVAVPLARVDLERSFGQSKRSPDSGHTPSGFWRRHVTTRITDCPKPVIWLGCTSYCRASPASVLLPRTAASATLALNAAECVRRGLLLMLAPVLTGDILALGSSVHPHRIVQFAGPAPNGYMITRDATPTVIDVAVGIFSCTAVTTSCSLSEGD